MINKTKKPIVRPLAPYAKHLMELTLSQTVKGEPIWPVQPELKSGFKRASLSYICKDHNIYIKKKLGADIPPFGLHDLRRTCRSLMEGLSVYGLVHAKAPLLALGHKASKIEETYNQWDYGNVLKEAYEVYERLVMAVLASESDDIVDIVQQFAEAEKIRIAKEKDSKVVDVADAFLVRGRGYKSA